MKLGQLISLVSRISYKPNWTVSVVFGEKFQLIWNVDVVDCMAQRPNALFTTEFELDWKKIEQLSEKEALDWVFDGIMQIEKHEAQEWFRLDQQCVDDPHGSTVDGRGQIV